MRLPQTLLHRGAATILRVGRPPFLPWLPALLQSPSSPAETLALVESTARARSVRPARNVPVLLRVRHALLLGARSSRLPRHRRTFCLGRRVVTRRAHVALLVAAFRERKVSKSCVHRTKTLLDCLFLGKDRVLHGRKNSTCGPQTECLGRHTVLQAKPTRTASLLKDDDRDPCNVEQTDPCLACPISKGTRTSSRT